MLCSLLVKNERLHYATCHPDAIPFLCGECKVSFKHRKSLKRHVDNVHGKSSKVKTIEKTFVKYSDYRKNIIGCTSFEEFLFIYRKLCNEKDDQLSEGVIANMLSYLKHVPIDLLNVTSDGSVFADLLDIYIDEMCVQVQVATVTTRLRHLRWYLRFQSCVNTSFDYTIMSEIDETISSFQSQGSIETTNMSIINVMDPYRLARLANHVVCFLVRLQREVIDVFLEKYFRNQEEVTCAHLYDFGAQYLRFFLELSMRFTNVALRIQCTSNLMMDTYSEPNFVAKLVRHPGHFDRIINKDKTGKYSQVTQISLCEMISMYMAFYIDLCRPDKASSYVFQTRNGKRWKSASKDVKKFLEEKGSINCDDIAPNGRFIHGSRHICLATYAILCKFDVVKLQNFATLLRHQLMHVENIYSPWLKMQMEKRACHELFQLRDQTKEEKHQDNFVVMNLESPKMHSCLKEMLRRAFFGDELRVVLRTRSIGTQTSLCEYSSTENVFFEVEDDEVLPKCETCGKEMGVFGPLGLKRSQHFGKYFLMCCQKRPDSKTTKYFKLGFKPRYPTNSAMPRNMLEIQVYIDKNK